MQGIGILVKAISGFYYVNCDNKVYECKARGNFRKAEVSPIVGDRVEFCLTDNEHGIIEGICERKNGLQRPLVANIDKLFIVSAFAVPSPDALMIDRLTAIAIYNKIEPIIVFNKSDMGSFDEFYHIYDNAGFKTYIVSAANNEGISDLRAETKNCVCAFSGNSGVGKSSIINALFPQLNLKTGEVSIKLGRGRHTTRHTQLFAVGKGSFVVDTPGFSSIENNDNLYDFKIKLPKCFPDFESFICDCKFSSCSHISEKGCSLLEAVEDGRVERSRHESYKTILSELKDVSEWNRKYKR